MSESTLLATQVGKLVARQPRTARVFETFQIDYCCRGKTTLEEACAIQGVDASELVGQLEALQADAEFVDGTNWNETSLTELADHIVNVHHGYLKTELPRLSGLVEKVVRAHGEKRPELANVAEVFEMVRSELESHMMKEENILFPAICALETDSGPHAFPFGSVGNPIGMMEHEHDDVGGALRRLRDLTDGYTPPANACPTYRVMLESLENLELDLHLHIHKENNILFPRAKELESSTNVA